MGSSPTTAGLPPADDKACSATWELLIHNVRTQRRMRAWVRQVSVQVLAVVATLWLFSHSIFILDAGYRSSLKALWKVQHGAANYTRVLTAQKMLEVAGMHKRDFLEGHNKARGTLRPWAAVEEELENALQGMFERTDPMKAWELKLPESENSALTVAKQSDGRRENFYRSND